MVVYDSIRIYYISDKGYYLGPKKMEARTVEEVDLELPSLIQQHREYDRYIVIGNVNHGDDAITKGEIEHSVKRRKL